MEIMSSTNAKVKIWMKYHQKKHRDIDASFLIEGEHLINEAIMANQLKTLIIRKDKENIFDFDNEVYIVSDEIMDKLSQNISSIDYIGVCVQKQVCFSAFNNVLLLDDIQDPGNLGTIIRSACSFGFQGVFVSKGCVDLYNDKVIRSTQGALFHIPLKQVELIDMIPILKEKGYKVYGTSLQEAKPLASYKKCDKLALLFGNEGQGVKKELLNICDSNIKIEMQAFESLNVAIAASICMYYFQNK